MLRIEFTAQFKKDYKNVIKQGFDSKKLEDIVTLLCEGKKLPVENRDHALTNSRNYKNVRECHIDPDWLLVYQISKKTLILKLFRTGL